MTVPRNTHARERDKAISDGVVQLGALRRMTVTREATGHEHLSIR
jgi:hypothetical protein